jgi:hypothetical protein
MGDGGVKREDVKRDGGMGAGGWLGCVGPHLRLLLGLEKTLPLYISCPVARICRFIKIILGCFDVSACQYWANFFWNYWGGLFPSATVGIMGIGEDHHGDTEKSVNGVTTRWREIACRFRNAW